MADDAHNSHRTTDSGGGESLCWRPWPCSSCGGSSNPIRHLIGSFGTSETVPDGDRNQIIEWLQQREASILLKWVESCAHTTWQPLNFPRIAEGSEHLVFFDQTLNEVVKVTREGLYGDYYEIVDNRINQFNCTPLEYLFRASWWEVLFSLSPLPEGITTKGQILSRQKFITGAPPSQEQVDDFLMQSDWTPVRKNCWLWQKEMTESAMNVWLGDARADNFVSSPQGLVPIDIRVWALPMQSEITTQP